MAKLVDAYASGAYGAIHGGSSPLPGTDEKSCSPLVKDLIIVAASILAASLLVKSGILHQLITSLHRYELVGSFIAGTFFTSVFTTAPAIAALGSLSLVQGPILVALTGAAGAVMGDLIIFTFVKDHLSKNIASVISKKSAPERWQKLFHLKFFRWFLFMVGDIIIASPLPDELGISLLGFSRMRLSWFIPLSFTFNFLGILAVAFLARAL